MNGLAGGDERRVKRDGRSVKDCRDWFLIAMTWHPEGNVRE